MIGRPDLQREQIGLKRSEDRILTTHVGSLIRPRAIQDILAARQNGVAVDEAYHRKVLTQPVAEIAKRQDRARRSFPG